MSQSARTPRVVFAHGKESGPWGHKIQALAAIAERHGFAADSPDYSAMADPVARRAHLQSLAPTGVPLVLVGSSMGGYVAAMACEALRPDALLLMAPALYLDGYPGEPGGCPVDTVVVHGWGDDVVPLAAGFEFAKARNAALHVVDDDHRLAASIEFIGLLFDRQLRRALGHR